MIHVTNWEEDSCNWESIKELVAQGLELMKLKKKTEACQREINGVSLESVSWEEFPIIFKYLKNISF